MTQRLKFLSHLQLNQIALAAASLTIAFMFTGCGSQQAQQYEATAVATSTWRVRYTNDPPSLQTSRWRNSQSFSTTLSQNLLKTAEFTRFTIIFSPNL